MKTRLLFPLLLIIINMGCIEDDGEEEQSECAKEWIEYLENMEESYDQQIAIIRNPDGTYYTLEQCEAQLRLANEFLALAEENEEDFNTDSRCSDKEKFDINNIFERLILEYEADVAITYDCE
ncbi:hypothetical protein Q4603_04685 [Zobellia galactanivorans]|uniref:hypothetical protein n=1 Tax=Zobellia galactanivorans (strain DSM 12802 / CCUG 47099 / CIP 106680 / NCIMB 13871 / Dsij) TaxID=63186 RepID=UPI0026E13CC1|nr:hypothetical protein [Zobellia galactanivorans]MDO6807887.1 hypothetical protein [Zobellia galactanivorans]